MINNKFLGLDKGFWWKQGSLPIILPVSVLEGRTDFSNSLYWNKAGLPIGIGAGELFFQIDRVGGYYSATGQPIMTPNTQYRLVMVGTATVQLNIWTIVTGDNSSRIQIPSATLPSGGALTSVDLLFTTPINHTGIYLRVTGASTVIFSQLAIYSV